METVKLIAPALPDAVSDVVHLLLLGALFEELLEVDRISGGGGLETLPCGADFRREFDVVERGAIKDRAMHCVQNVTKCELGRRARRGN